MPLFTSSWFAPLPENHVQIGVSRGVTRGFPPGYRVMRELAPGPWFKNVSVSEYRRRFEREFGAT